MRDRKRRLARGILVGALLAAPASAQTNAAGDSAYPECRRTPTKGDTEAARSKYLAGKVDYDEAKYDAAIAQFREAYARDCTKHDLLVIISRAYELKGDKGEAIAALKTYLKRVPEDSPAAAAHRNRLANMETAYEAQQAAEANASKQPAVASEPVNEPVRPEDRKHTVFPWIVVGLGGAAMIAGPIVAALSPSMPAGCSSETEKCTKFATDTDASFRHRQQEAGRAKDQPTIGWGIFVGGVVVAGLGLLWHFLEPTGRVERKSVIARSRLRPEIARGFGGLSLSGRF
jgi:hypothetical protein